MSRLRIVHVGKFYPPHMGGIETHLETLCRQLAQRHDIEAIVSNDGRRTVIDRNGPVPIRRVGTVATLASAPICPALGRAIRQAKPDLVHLHVPNPIACLALLASGFRGPVVTTYHSDVVRQKLLGSLFEPFLRLALRRSSAIVCTSHRYLETSPAASCFQNKCVVIPYGIPPVAHVDPEKVESLRRRYGPRIVLAVGRLVYYKGFDTLLEAMRSVDARLLLVGEGPLRGRLAGQAAASGVSSRVKFLGEIQNADLGPYYRAADVFAFPSVARSEAFGIVQLEAMAHGLPVVNTNLDSGVPFVSPHRQTGFTVEPRDATSLARALNELLSNHPLRAQFSAAARDRVAEEFTAATMTARMEALYEAVLEGQPLPGPTATAARDQARTEPRPAAGRKTAS